ncbi:MAG TPA: serine/threonine-protein kinase [Burkholderiales bacterium]|nr:serine/threonine-protein kinase [Burkholderiales bacterium]
MEGDEVETTIREDTQRIGKFALVERLGKGSSGTVYKALDTFSGQEVALKVLDASLFAGAGMKETSRQQFMNEASLAGRLQHPHIAAILEASIDEKSGYIAVEYVPGGDLSGAVLPDGLRPVEDVFEIAFKCCGALDYAYRQGIIHRDIKPANLMVSEGSQIKIVDFGAALLTNTQHTQIQDVGTPSYMSPEQVRGGSELSFQSDMFSLGVVLYGLFTGQRPFTGETVTQLLINIVEKDPPLPSEWRPELDREVDRILMRMLRKAPDKRYPGWADLAFDLAEIGRFSVYVKEISDREKFTALRGFKPLETLNDAEIWELVHASYWVRVPAQTVIMKEGDKGAELLFLAQGEVKVVKSGRLLNVLRTGSYFGEMAHVKKGEIPRQATVETLTDALIAEFRPAAMKKLSVNCQLQLSQSLLNTVVDRLMFADERIAHA